MKKTEYETALSPSLAQELVLFLTRPENALMAQGMISNTKRNYVNQHHPRKISQMHSSDKYRDGKWSTYVYIDGKRRMVEKQTEEEIYNYLFDFYKAQEAGPKTFDDVFELYIKDKLAHGRVQHTIDEYRRHIGYLDIKIRQKPIIDITEKELRDWLRDSYMPTKPKKDGLKKTLEHIKAVFKQARKENICKYSPAENILLEEYVDGCDLEVKTNEERSFSIEDNAKLKEYALQHTDNPHALVLLVSMETGLRIGELVAIKKPDVMEHFFHIHRQQRKIPKSETNEHQEFVVVNYTKNERQNPRGGRKTPITTECKRILDIALAYPGESEYVFHHKDGRPIQKDSYGQYLKRVCKRLGITATNNHAFRIAFNGRLDRAGLELNTKCLFLGNSPETNMKHYSGADERRAEEAWAKLDVTE